MRGWCIGTVRKREQRLKITLKVTIILYFENHVKNLKHVRTVLESVNQFGL